MRTTIAIDPGVNTGFAVTDDGELTQVETFTITAAQHWIRHMLGYASDGSKRTIELVIEDPRGQYLPPSQREQARIKGVGSVERDCKIWIEFAEYYGIPYRLVKPGKYRKIDDATFRKWTGWDKRTSEHARCAAMMIWTGQ